MVTFGQISVVGIALAALAAAVFFRKELGETAGFLGTGFSSIGRGFGTGFSSATGGISRGISSLLSPQITPTFVPTIGFNIVGTLNNSNESTGDDLKQFDSVADQFGGNMPTKSSGGRGGVSGIPSVSGARAPSISTRFFSSSPSQFL